MTGAEIALLLKKIRTALAAIKAFRDSGGGGSSLAIWGAMIFSFIATMAAALIMLLPMFMPLFISALVLDKVADIPALSQLGGFFSGIGCTLGSDSACKLKETFDELDQVKDAIKAAVDCDNLPPNWDKNWCDPNAMDDTEDKIPNPIPAKARWMIPLYKSAAKHYDVPWELVAAVHGARNDFSFDQDKGQMATVCKDKGGHFRFDSKEFEHYQVVIEDGEEFYDDKGNDCYKHTVHFFVQDKNLLGDKIWKEYNTLADAKDDYPNIEKGKPKSETRDFDPKKIKDSQVDEGFSPNGDSENYDAVEAIYTEAHILNGEGAKGADTWNYNGDPSGGCNNYGPEGNDITPYYIGSGQLKGEPSKFDQQILAAAQKYDVNPALIKGVMRQESGFNPLIASPVGAGGLMQIMPDTAHGLGMPHTEPIRKVGNHYELSPTDDRADPVKNIEGGTRYLKNNLRDFHNDFGTVLAAYNAGPNKAREWARASGDPYIIESASQITYSETRNYFTVVQRFAKEYGWDGKTVNNAGVVQKPGEEKEIKYSGKDPTDKVSKAVRSRYGSNPDYSYCYVATVHDWYNAIHEWSTSSEAQFGSGLGNGQLAWPVSPHILVSPFGWRASTGTFHEGNDLVGILGFPIYAPEDGTVIWNSEMSGYGYVVVVRHEGDLANVATLSAHQPHVSEFVKVGDHVKRGQRIGTVGCSGHCFGPHDHFEVLIFGKAPQGSRPGPFGGSWAVDPQPWFTQNG